MQPDLRLELVSEDERDLIEDLIQSGTWTPRNDIFEEDDGEEVALVIEIDGPDVEKFLSILADDPSDVAGELLDGIREEMAKGDNPGALGPALSYNPQRKKKEEFSDGTEFVFSQCDQGSHPENTEIDTILSDQGPLIPPWARFQSSFNIQTNPAQALAHSLADEEVTEIIQADFSPMEVPMAIAANRARRHGKIVKAIPLPATTPTRLRCETLDEKMQGWAYPAEKGQYYVFWSNGDLSLVNRQEVHWIQSLIRYEDVLKEYLWANDPFLPKELGIDHTNILGENDKLIKGRDEGYYSLGLSLSPWSIAGIGNLCPYATKNCAAACLNASGRGEMATKGVQVGEATDDISWIQEFRKRRTYLFLKNRDEFNEILYAAIEDALYEVHEKKTMGGKAKGKPNPVYGMELCVRLNTLSDVPWPDIKYRGSKTSKPMSFIDIFSHGDKKVMFYDYTKNILMMERFLTGKLPKNYYLTFSWSEADAPYAFEVLKQGGAVAVPFDTTPIMTRHGKKHLIYLPKWWNGFKVIDADISDIRYMDADFFTRKDMVSERWTEQDRQELVAELKAGRGFVCGLRLKGVGARDRHWTAKMKECKSGAPPTSETGGFVQYADDAGMRPSGDPAQYSGLCMPGSGRQCEFDAPKGAKEDQIYVPECNLTDKSIHPDPYRFGEDYKSMLIKIGAANAAAQAKEGFVATYKQLQKLNLAE